MGRQRQDCPHHRRSHRWGSGPPRRRRTAGRRSRHVSRLGACVVCAAARASRGPSGWRCHGARRISPAQQMWGAARLRINAQRTHPPHTGCARPAASTRARLSSPPRTTAQPPRAAPPRRPGPRVRARPGGARRGRGHRGARRRKGRGGGGQDPGEAARRQGAREAAASRAHARGGGCLPISDERSRVDAMPPLQTTGVSVSRH